MITVHPASAPLRGTFTVEGDKSITHRALFFGALNRGTTRIVCPSRAADCRSSRRLLETVGYRIGDLSTGWEIDGRHRPAPAVDELLLDCGNSGTTARLAFGFLTGETGNFRLTGDRSLVRRPMERVAAPLRALGADIVTTDGRLPAEVRASGRIDGSPDGLVDVASAQVHAALVLAGLRSRHGIRIRRTDAMRDHTLRMLSAFGVGIGDGEIDRIEPVEIERDIDLPIPGDISSAVFLVVAALLVPCSGIRIENVGLNPSRIAFLEAARIMGADLDWSIDDSLASEPIGTIMAAHGGDLRGIDLGDGGIAARVPVAAMIDELPLLALLGSVARGRTRLGGARELRLKESDRISATLELLASLGIESVEREDGFEIDGPQKIKGSRSIDHHDDHRLCMLAAVAALAAREPVTIDREEVAAVSWPGFFQEIARLTVIR